MSLSADDQSEEEKWLQEHNKQFQSPGAFGAPEAHGWKPSSRTESDAWKGRTRKRKERMKKLRQAKRPIHVGKTKQKCPHCGQEASVELFRDTKCLACQASDFLGPIH